MTSVPPPLPRHTPSPGRRLERTLSPGGVGEITALTGDADRATNLGLHAFPKLTLGAMNSGDRRRLTCRQVSGKSTGASPRRQSARGWTAGSMREGGAGQTWGGGLLSTRPGGAEVPSSRSAQAAGSPWKGPPGSPRRRAEKKGCCPLPSSRGPEDRRDRG